MGKLEKRKKETLPGAEEFLREKRITMKRKKLNWRRHVWERER
jgi:hypothetical protein